MREEYLKDRISKLRKEIEELEERRYATHKRQTVTNYEYNSDEGVKTPFGEKEISVEMSNDELNASRRAWELQLYSLRSKLKQAQDELFKLEWNKPENVARREKEALIKSNEERKEQLEEEQAKHEERYDDLNKLVEYLEIAGLDDLARNLSKLRLANHKPKSPYIEKEIELSIKKEEVTTNVKTTKKEYKQLRKSVLKLNKEATRMAKKYKDLYDLYRNACKIVQDIEDKGISKMHGKELYDALKNYFTQPTGKYLFRDHGNYYSRKESENLGYQYLAFYRDSGSKYNEDVRRHVL